jgi:hypothetical protein
VIVLANSEALIKTLEYLGPILWEPGKEGRVGWAICPCCGKRNLKVEIKILQQVEEGE